MSQIDELQSRLTRALDRIAQGVEGLSAPVEQPDTSAEDAAAAEAAKADRYAMEAELNAAVSEAARMRDLLDEEKMANAQLEERVRVLRARLNDTPTAPSAPDVAADAALREQLEAQRESLAALDGEVQRMRLSNEMLMRTNQEMREALLGNVGEPHLVNKAMLAELEALRAARALEEAEARAVLGALEPLLAQAAGETSENTAPETSGNHGEAAQ
ncbi:hypothetical protein GCM10011415_03630 [Salipiger pallidus]|uniref:Uncharacterized protein n=1 Tax=Salipiger pallidus TaxID=1775170 RepID=A0A8J3EFM5_9RHOB|nr:hypothetical protein [Salipiger pallidus]GGG60901.1 hypothetical protein GCM10011415_03630 [Salipiger pallidus]